MLFALAALLISQDSLLNSVVHVLQVLNGLSKSTAMSCVPYESGKKAT